MSENSQISLRKDSKGGGLRKRPAYSGDIFNIRRHAILLVHGFNRDEDEAERLYAIFKKNISCFGRNYNRNVIDVLWPGDWHFPVGRSIAYPKKIETAKKCGALLANDYLIEKLIKIHGTRMQEVTLIGHSLGCRLVLEALRELYIKRPTSVRVRAVLMAAAVPREFVKNGGRLHEGIRLAKKTLVLYSKADKILELAFPPGQALAGEPGDAIGLKGEPEDIWETRLSMENFGHSEYWISNETAQNIANWMGSPILRVKPSRKMPSRETAANREIELPKKDLKTRHLKEIILPK